MPKKTLRYHNEWIPTGDPQIMLSYHTCMAFPKFTKAIFYWNLWLVVKAKSIIYWADSLLGQSTQGVSILCEELFTFCGDHPGCYHSYQVHGDTIHEDFYRWGFISRTSFMVLIDNLMASRLVIEFLSGRKVLQT